MITVGILDDGVAGAPEGVVRRLTARVTRADELSVALVDGLSRRYGETYDRLRSYAVHLRPAAVEALRQCHAVEVEVEPVWQMQVDVMRAARSPPNGALRDLQAEASIKSHRCIDVANDRSN